MMNSVLLRNSLTNNLQEGIDFVTNLSAEQYNNATIPPFYSSIGAHIRHIIEICQAVTKGLDSEDKIIDLSYRARDIQLQTRPEMAIEALNLIKLRLSNLRQEDLEQSYLLRDDLGLGMVHSQTLLSSVLIQIYAHNVHHYSFVKQLAFSLDASFEVHGRFGLNATTPKS
ncbi:MAG: hypothetical protein ACPGRE_03620 [Flavobacteriaceae bacterium]